MPFTKKVTSENLQSIKNWLHEGLTYTEIVKKLDNKVSRQRIQQIAKKTGIHSVSVRRDLREEQLNQKMFAKWGPNWQNREWRKSDIYAAMREKFRNKKKNTYEHEFTIEFGDLEFPTHCPILGLKLDYFAETRQENSPSFDRIDPSKGYIKGNVAIVSWRANRIKNDGTAEEHYKIAEFITTHSVMD